MLQFPVVPTLRPPDSSPLMNLLSKLDSGESVPWRGEVESVVSSKATYFHIAVRLRSLDFWKIWLLL